MLTAAAVCPHPPLLVPEVAQAAAPELADVRRACERAVADLEGADEIVVVGSGARTVEHAAAAGGSLSAYGRPLSVGTGPAVLPLSLTIGRWLLERAGLRAGRFVEVAADASPQECRLLGVRLGAEAPRMALLSMGDGSARHGRHAPGDFDARAAPYDRSVAEALGGADGTALGRLAPDTAEELLVAGRPAWQVLAGAAEGAGLAGKLLSYEAPYGVGYFVAVWS